MNNSPIGVFDSGLGGLSVWRVLRKALRSESFVYLGDGLRCPYGSRSAEEVCRFAEEAVERLLAMGCKLVVIACNTATAAAIGHLREKYPDTPFVGLEPAVKPAALSTRSGIIGVLATRRSLEGDHFRRTSAKYGDTVRILGVVGEGFVEIVESNGEHTPQAAETVCRVIAPLVEAGADRIVLGCTHYPFLREQIERAVEGHDVEIIDSADAIERRVEYLLDEFGMRAADDNVPHYDFVTFADEEYRKKICEKAMK